MWGRALRLSAPTPQVYNITQKSATRQSGGARLPPPARRRKILGPCALWWFSSAGSRRAERGKPPRGRAVIQLACTAARPRRIWKNAKKSACPHFSGRHEGTTQLKRQAVSQLSNKGAENKHQTGSCACGLCHAPAGATMERFCWRQMGRQAPQDLGPGPKRFRAGKPIWGPPSPHTHAYIYIHIYIYMYTYIYIYPSSVGSSIPKSLTNPARWDLRSQKAIIWDPRKYGVCKHKIQFSPGHIPGICIYMYIIYGRQQRMQPSKCPVNNSLHNALHSPLKLDRRIGGRGGSHLNSLGLTWSHLDSLGFSLFLQYRSSIFYEKNMRIFDVCHWCFNLFS